jgi:LysM repeat protein
VTADRVRIWLVRILAPILFVAAAVGLVVVVQRALDSGGANDTVTAATSADTVQVTTAVDGTTGPATTGGEPRFYRIKQGDTLDGIAARFDTTVDAILELNPEITDPFAIQPGQRIRVA